MVFLEVSSWILLSIFLVYLVGCMIVTHRVLGLYACDSKRGSALWKILLCIVVALILTVLTVYLWFVFVFALMVITRQLCRRYTSDKIKILITTGMTILMILIAVAGLQMMLGGDEEDDEDSEASLIVEGMVQLEDRDLEQYW